MGQASSSEVCSSLNQLCCQCEKYAKDDERHEANFNADNLQKKTLNRKQRLEANDFQKDLEQNRVLINTYSHSSLKLPSPQNDHWLASKLN